MGLWVDPLNLDVKVKLTEAGVQVLCYEDTSAVREFQEKFKTYEDKFPGCTGFQPFF